MILTKNEELSVNKDSGDNEVKEKETCSCAERLGKVGGEAVIEGVMMKSGDRVATACRKPDGSITVKKSEFVSVRKKHKILNFPLIRGVVGFAETLRLSMASLNDAAEVMGVEEEETKFEKWLKSKLGLKLMDVVTVVATVAGVLLSLFLFLYLPSLAAKGLAALTNGATLPFTAVIEGVLKIAIFVGYLYLVSLLPDIRRTFEYHGAEHKSIACFESGDELTPANAKKYTRFHPRCGTSFMFVMILIGIAVGFLIPASLPAVLRAAVKLLLLPVVVGVGYEFIMYAGRHNNLSVRILSAPGLWMQRLTTREPDEEQLEVAIAALKSAMPDLFPDFDPNPALTADDTAESEKTPTDDTEGT